MRVLILVTLVFGACVGAEPERAPVSTPDATAPGSDTLALSNASDGSTEVPGCVIGPDGIGPIQLGMTLQAARTTFPSAAFERDTDGDGAALIAVVVADSALMILYAGEDDASQPIDWSRPISFIETFNAACRRPDGVGPGSLVADVERLLGPTRRVTLSEIESREYIEFERQPAGVIFRLDYTGVFPEGARETTRTAPGAKILSVMIVRP